MWWWGSALGMSVQVTGCWGRREGGHWVHSQSRHVVANTASLSPLNSVTLYPAHRRTDTHMQTQTYLPVHTQVHTHKLSLSLSLSLHLHRASPSPRRPRPRPAPSRRVPVWSSLCPPAGCQPRSSAALLHNNRGNTPVRTVNTQIYRHNWVF